MRGSPITKKPTVASITRLIQYRGVTKSPDKAESLGAFMPAWYEREVLKPARTMDFLEPLWRELPELLRHSCRLKGIHRSILTIVCDQPSARMELERLLRNGLLLKFQAASHGRIKRVKAVVGYTPNAP